MSKSTGQSRQRGSGRSTPSTYERLKEAILTGEIGEGESLVESSLAGRFEVSRTPIREALNKLERDGLVERRARGLEVRARSPEEILDIYETRIVLEAKVAEVAASRRTEFDVLRLQQLAERGEALRERSDADPDALEVNNREFHEAVWKASRNESLVDLLERLNLHLMRYPRTTLASDGRWARAVAQHRALVDAIEQRDGERASQIAAEHFIEARDIRFRLWREQLA